MNAANRPSNHNLQAIRERFFSDGNPVTVLAERTALVNSVLQSAFLEYLAPVFPKGMAVLAVGGYGRSELFPHSDVDVLLLVERAPSDEKSRDALSAFLRTGWDSGLRISHSVHTVEECCEYHTNNLELTISLLDQRLVCGDNDLYQTLVLRLPKFIAGERQTLIRHLIRQARERQEKFQNTVYHLEPNIKEAPGGLRDLHVIGWLAKLQDASRDLPDWLGELGSEIRFLHTLRCYLHFVANRDQNILQFDAQEDIVRQPFIEGIDTAKPVEGFMRRYFLAARRIHRAAKQAVDVSESLVPSGLFSQFREWRTRLSTSEISVGKERLFLRNPQALESDPELVLRLMLFTARHGLVPATDTERRITKALPAIEKYFAEPRPLWNYLREIFALPHAMLALRTMHETGVCGAVLPEWRMIEGFVIRDFYHRYTVDEHTLIVAENLLALRAPADGPRRRFAELLTEVDSLPLLILAILLHDIGKSIDGPTHAQESARLGETIMARIQMPEEERPFVRFLVEQHLVLSSIMNSRDLDDPATAKDLAAKAGTVENLRYLALMTYADISGVNPTAMTPWRLEQLWRVYSIGLRELTRELDTDRIHVEPNAPAGDFLEGFPSRYLRTHSKEEVEAHLALEQQARQTGVAVDLTRQGGVWKMTLVTLDKPRLFASIVGALSGFGMDIVKAEAFSNAKGEVLDAFTFSDPGRALELNPPEVDRLRGMIEKAAMGTLDVRQMLDRRSRPPSTKRGERLRPTIYFDSEASSHATLVEIVAEDRTGLLYDFARVFAESNCNIEVVLIDTEAHKALDVFYLTCEGRKLTGNEQFVLEDRLRAACLA
jgi:[protein-PII] uridylyltransferase